MQVSNMSSNKTGEGRVLTVFTVITTPMMLVGTWYGMNDDMPEMVPARPPFYAFGVTVAATLGTVVYFKPKVALSRMPSTKSSLLKRCSGASTCSTRRICSRSSSGWPERSVSGDAV